MPSVCVASSDGFGTDCAVVDSEVEGDSAIATRGISG